MKGWYYVIFRSPDTRINPYSPRTLSLDSIIRSAVIEISSKHLFFERLEMMCSKIESFSHVELTLRKSWIMLADFPESQCDFGGFHTQC